MPPGCPMAGRVWRFTMWTPWTMTRFSAGIAFSTSPDFPLSRPAMTTTLSPFFTLSFALDIPASQHLWRERHDLHEFPGAQLARHRTEDARADRLALLVD